MEKTHSSLSSLLLLCCIIERRIDAQVSLGSRRTTRAGQKRTHVGATVVVVVGGRAHTLLMTTRGERQVKASLAVQVSE